MAAREGAPDRPRPQPGSDARPQSTPRPRPRPDTGMRPAGPGPVPRRPETRTGALSRRAALLTGAAGLMAVAGLTPHDGIDVRSRRARDSAAGIAAVRYPAPVRDAAVHRPTVRTGTTTTQQRSTRAGRAPIRSLGDANRLLHRQAFDPQAIMLTLDDGPDPIWTPRLLDLLGHAGVTATFFMIGSQVDRHPGVAREVAARGHVIGNHTWTHDLQLGLRPVHRIRSEIDRTSHAIHATCGVVPTQFRAPGGYWTPRLLDVLAREHLVPVGWDLDPTDWARPGMRSITRTLLHIRPHDIALCHDGGGDRSQTYHALRLALPRLRQRGFTFATLPARLTTSAL